MDKAPRVHMPASGRNGTLYIGVTGNPPARVARHKAGKIDGFGKAYGVKRLVWFERNETMESA
jgi:putative endonuclease